MPLGSTEGGEFFPQDAVERCQPDLLLPCLLKLPPKQSKHLLKLAYLQLPSVSLPSTSGWLMILCAKPFRTNVDEHCSHFPQLLVYISLCSGFQDLVQVHINLEPLSFPAGSKPLDPVL